MQGLGDDADDLGEETEGAFTMTADGGLRRAIAILAFLGAGIAAYVSYTRLAGTRLACPIGGCETVQSSRWFELLGVPVSVYGFGAYAGILVTAARPTENAAAAGTTLALAGVAFCGYLLYAEAFLIGAFCTWCAVSNGLMVALLALTGLRLRRFLCRAPAGRPRLVA